jgi:integrase
VFSSLNPLDPSATSKALKRAAVAAGFPTLHLHDLRHAYASALARAGVAPGVIGTLLGDRTPAIVFRYSRHAPKSAEAEAVGLLSAARGQAPAKGEHGIAQGTAKAHSRSA